MAARAASLRRIEVEDVLSQRHLQTVLGEIKHGSLPLVQFY